MDYPALPGKVTFAAGEIATTLIGRPTDDAFVEGDEPGVASLACDDSAVATYRILGQAASAIGTIIDNERSVGNAFVRITAPQDGAVLTDPVPIDFEARNGDR